MNKKMYLVTVLCVIFSMTHLAKADVLFHWSFDGLPGQELISATDHVSTTSLKMFNNPDIMGYVAHGKPNPWFNTRGTSAEFINDRVHKNHGAALAATDTGENTTLDLSTLDAFTIEFFLCSYGLNDCVLVGKSGGVGGYSVELLSDGEVRFTINSDNNSISSIPGTIRHSTWHHIAAVFDQKDNQAPMKLYVNGILVIAGGTSQSVRDSTNSFCVGTRLDRNNDPPKHDPYVNKFSGRLDELRISDVPLEPHELLNNAIPTKARYPYPEDRAEQCSRTTHLTWRPARGVTSQRVYFGTDPTNLSPIAEVGPDVTGLTNKQLGGMLDAETTYYWRVDSKADSGSVQDDPDLEYEFDGEGKGETWTFITQGDRVDGDYFKWLLHLGQNPNDSLLGDYRYCQKITRLVEDGNVRPKPGEIYDLEDQSTPWDCPANRDMLIWTPQYSITGFFEGYGGEEHGIHHFYHIYIISPEERRARLHFWAYNGVHAWNNGTSLYQGGSGYNSREHYHDFVLEEGVNSMTFEVGGSDYYLSVRLTDCNDHAFTDVTYSLAPPRPDMDVLVKRRLPDDYGSKGICDVALEVTVEPTTEPDDLTVIEYIPEGLTVAEAGGGLVVGNSISWTLDPNEAAFWSITYSLAVPPNHSGIVPFLGYVYHNQNLTKIMGDEAVFDELPCSPADMAAEIDTIEIDTRDYIAGEDVTIEDIGELFSGLRASPDGGWAQYEFDITYPGRYQILVEYAEYWTVFHHGANISLSVDNEESVQTTLFPTLHSYVVIGRDVNYSRGPVMANRHALWMTDTVDLTEGRHTLGLLMEPLDISNEQTDRYGDERPVVNRITLTNYPGLTVPAIAEPHHLDSYEHPPARLVHDRDVQILPGGRVEMTYYGTFYSLSQGNEIYFAQGHVCPKPGEDTAKFEIVSFEPEVFHLWPEGEQNFVLTVRSRESLPEDYSELVILWLQGTPSCPARKPYLFATGQSYVALPPYKQPEFDWGGRALLDHVHYVSRKVNVDMTDPPDIFVPDRDDLGFNEGRYSRSLGDFFGDQFASGKLP
ncbi:MAG: LamG domain-containing protein, partial [Candidatus Thorarchaeota archaeon]